MKSMTTILGMILIIVGVITLGYQGYTYKEREKILQIGDLQVTAETQKRVYFPPYLGGAALVAGIVLVIVSRK